MAFPLECFHTPVEKTRKKKFVDATDKKRGLGRRDMLMRNGQN
jgi:hypothetical protein